MSYTATESLFPASAEPASRSRPKVKGKLRATVRAAAWGRHTARAADYLMQMAKTDDQLALAVAAYDAECELGPDFARHHSGSRFMDAPPVKIDGNAYARLLQAVELIERGTYRFCRRKCKQGLPRTVAPVLKALLNLARKYGRVFPCYVGLGKLAGVSKNTAINCVALLELYGFITKHRRIKTRDNAFGGRVVQDSNAYEIHDAPRGLGAIALALFKRASESKRCAAESKIFIPSISAEVEKAALEARERLKRAHQTAQARLI